MEGIHQVQDSTHLDLVMVAIHSKEAMVVLPMEVEVEEVVGDTMNALTEGGEEEASEVGQEGDVDQAMKEEQGEGVGDSMNSRSQIQVRLIRKEMPIDSNDGRTSVYCACSMKLLTSSILRPAMECSIRDVMPGVLWKACWGKFSFVYMGTWPMFGRLLLHVQGKYRAALALIQSSSIDLFNSGKSNSVRLCLTLDRAVG